MRFIFSSGAFAGVMRPKPHLIGARGGPRDFCTDFVFTRLGYAGSVEKRCVDGRCEKSNSARERCNHLGKQPVEKSVSSWGAFARNYKRNCRGREP